MSGLIPLLVRALDEAFDRKSWHGTNLRGSIRGVSAAEAGWRPHPDRHNIHEQVLHAAYWKYTVRRRLLGEKRGSFPLKGSNWFRRPAGEGDPEAAWQADVKLLVEVHVSLRAAIAGLKEVELSRRAAGGSTPVLALVTGITAHDLYHAGQIQLLKRLYADAAGRSTKA